MATPARLYLDAARLGAMSPMAQLAARDFARLAGEGLSTLYCEQFFRGRCSRLSELHGLRDWRGLDHLRADFRRMVNAPADAPVLLASRTRGFMHSAAEYLATHCRRVLTTDSLWPEYRKLLNSACQRRGTRVSTLSIRCSLQTGVWSRRELLESIVRTQMALQCDGVLLSSVSHDGLRIPLTATVQAIRTQQPQTRIVIDAAQEFSHVPVNLAAAACDLFFTGCHKWLGAYQPLGVAVLPNASTAADVGSAIRQHLDDPLFDYIESLTGDAAAPPAETVNLVPLVCAHGALQHGLRRTGCRAQRFRRQRSSARHLAAIARHCGWNPGRLSPELRTGIVLLQSNRPEHHLLPPSDMEECLLNAGITATAYPCGTLRLSLPPRRLSPAMWTLLRKALMAATELAGQCHTRADSPIRSEPHRIGPHNGRGGETCISTSMRSRGCRRSPPSSAGTPGDEPRR